MTGLDLIKWIIKHDAEDKVVLVEHRDEGGSYHSAERLGEYCDPELCEFRNESWGVVRDITYDVHDGRNFKPNAIIL